MRTLEVVGAHDADREGQEQGLVPLGLPPRIKRDRLRGVQRGNAPLLADEKSVITHLVHQVASTYDQDKNDDLGVPGAKPSH